MNEWLNKTLTKGTRIMIKRILVGLGSPDHSTSAIRQAVALGQAHGAELTGVGIVDEGRLGNTGPVPIGAGHFARELADDRVAKAREYVERASRELAEECGKAGVRHRFLNASGEPFEVLIDQARYHDLTIAGLRGLFDFDLIPDPQDALARLVQAGVRPLVAVAKEVRPIRKVLIAYSGSMESAKAMKRFVEMRLWPEARLRVVTFEHPPEVARELVADAAAYCRAHGFDTEEAAVAESARSHLLPYAETQGADLLVVGNSARNLLLRKLFGETALHAIQNSRLPLFLAQ